MQICIWNQVRFEIPDDWEMLRFSKSADEGQCAFADRYAFRLEWTWKAAPHEPDFDRILSTYRESLEKNGRLRDAAVESFGPWHALTGREQLLEKTWTVQNGTLQPDLLEAERAVSRWGRYLPDLERMIEFVFLGDAVRDRDFEHRILNGVRPEPTYPGAMQRWRAFGVDLLAPKRLPLASCTVEPARCRIQFLSEDERESWSVQRLGMLPEWLKVSPGEWFQHQHPQGLQGLRTEELRRAGHDVCCATATVPARGLRLPARRYEAAAWACPHDGRLYTLRRILREPHGIPVAQTPGMELACCGRLGALS